MLLSEPPRLLRSFLGCCPLLLILEEQYWNSEALICGEKAIGILSKLRNIIGWMVYDSNEIWRLPSLTPWTTGEFCSYDYAVIQLIWSTVTKTCLALWSWWKEESPWWLVDREVCGGCSLSTRSSSLSVFHVMDQNNHWPWNIMAHCVLRSSIFRLEGLHWYRSCRHHWQSEEKFASFINSQLCSVHTTDSRTSIFGLRWYWSLLDNDKLETNEN